MHPHPQQVRCGGRQTFNSGDLSIVRPRCTSKLADAGFSGQHAISDAAFSLISQHASARSLLSAAIKEICHAVDCYNTSSHLHACMLCTWHALLRMRAVASHLTHNAPGKLVYPATLLSDAPAYVLHGVIASHATQAAMQACGTANAR